MLHVANCVSEAVRRTSTNSTNPTPRVTDVESETLGRIRREMLLSPSSRELRRSMYEIESHLARYPHSPAGRELKDQVQIALLRAEAYERPLASKLASDARSDIRMSRGSGPMKWLIPAAIAVGIVYGVLRYLGVF